ncbi:PAS domain S-box protein [Halovulum dunhuangense]|uniref:histidine kinase n=1 Tax=Halovulum dunhuangense TaxID=1505036 RepID=A0A849L7K3_9RHOB|nr:PAS domain S-box protein [Halovulum dunhuangense]
MTRVPELSANALDAFDQVLVPVWIFSIESLKILEANQSALDWLGYDLATLRTMTIADLRPEPDRARIIETVRRFEGTRADAGTWTIIDRSGRRFTAHFSWSRVSYKGMAAVVASIRDMTLMSRAEALAANLRVQNDALRRRASLSAEHLSRLVDALPGKMLVVTPGDYRVVAVTDEYAKAVMLDRDALLDRHLFDLFPDDPNEPGSDGVANLENSLRRVEVMRVTDVMNLQRYPVRRPDGSFEERFWLPTNKPVLDADGNVIHIVHRVEDVTALVAESAVTQGNNRASPRELSEARNAFLALEERETRLRTAEMLLELGAFECDFNDGTFRWSDRAFDIFGVPRDRSAPNFDGYVALVHPDDQQAMLENYRRFIETGAPEIEFQHRIIRADGAVTYVHGMGARHRVDGKEIVIGFVQDITYLREAEEKLRGEAQRRRFASRLVSLGSWRYDIGQATVAWGDGIAAIHDEPEATSPSVEQAISYYIPEHRGLIRERFDACVQKGVSFDEICQIITAKGRKVWVRAIGEPVRDASGRIIAVQGAFQDVSDLINARDAASELSERLRTTLERMSDAFFLLDEDWNFAFMNSRAEELLLRPRDELLGRNFWVEFPEAVGTQFDEQYRRAVSLNCPVRFAEYYAPLEAWLEVAADPTPQGLAVHFRDITLQRARDFQLRLLEAAAARMNDILLITEAEPISGPDGPRIVYVNDAFERRTGFSREEAIGKTPRLLQGPKTERAELDRIRNALSRWQPVRAELTNYTKTGEEIWLELDIVPLADETGWYTHWVAIERDISERRQAEQALNANEERFRLVTKAAGTAIWDWHVADDKQWWSEGLQDIFGHTPDKHNVVPTIWRQNVHVDDVARVDAALDRLVSGEDSILKETYRFRRSDGSWAIVEDRAFALRDGTGSAVRVLGSMTDVTDKTQLEERLRQAQRLEVVGQLTGGVAHDFNNLLTIILGNAELLEEALGGQPALQKLARMSLDAADRGAALTSQLLAFSRRQPLAPKIIDVANLILGMDGLLRRTLPENIDMEIVNASDLWQIEADAAQLESALLNLIVNARDAMPNGGWLTIEATNTVLDNDYIATEPDVRQGQYVVIVVTDTGHGIPHDILGRIFEPFFTTKGVGKGSGLGLSMVYGFVKQSGGHVRVYSEPGEGTAFKLYFPRAQGGPAPMDGDVHRQIIAGGTESILVVEDDPGVRDHVSTQLRGLGYVVLEASSGNEAMDVLRRTPDVDLLLTDVVMPGGMGGRELAEAARGLRPDIRILFTSGYTESSFVHDGRLDPNIILLSKPYRREDLASKVREALEEQHGP